MFVKLISGCA